MVREAEFSTWDSRRELRRREGCGELLLLSDHSGAKRKLCSDGRDSKMPGRNYYPGAIVSNTMVRGRTLGVRSMRNNPVSRRGNSAGRSLLWRRLAGFKLAVLSLSA